jgi:hypothetical protein
VTIGPDEKYYTDMITNKSQDEAVGFSFLINKAGTVKEIGLEGLDLQP